MMMGLMILLTIVIYLVVHFVSATIGNHSIYHRASSLREILSFENFINRDVLCFDVFIDVMLKICIITIAFLAFSSNHFIMSLNILYLLYTLLTATKYLVKKAQTLPVI